MKDIREQYTKRDIAKILGDRPIRTIQYYTDFGLVIPDIAPAQGKGKTRIYSDRNLVEFAMIEYMTADLKVDLNTVKVIMDVLRRGSFTHMYMDPPVKETFKDFFRDKQWGVDKELVYYESIFVDEEKQSLRAVKNIILPVVSFHVLKQKQDLVSFDPRDGAPMAANRLLWLGQIKRQAALNILGMKNLLSTDVFSF